MTQNEAVLAYLREGNSLTPIEALNRFGSFRLGARIFEIRKLLGPGEEIVTDTVDIGKGRHVARYRIARPANVMACTRCGNPAPSVLKLTPTLTPGEGFAVCPDCQRSSLFRVRP